MRTLSLMLACTLLAAAAAAQSYTVSSGAITSGYQDISGGTGVNISYGQLSSEIAPTGFSLQYFGNTYTSFKVGASGYMILGSAGTTTATTAAHGTAPGLVIAPMWTPLDLGGSLYSQFAPSLPAPGELNYLYSGGILSVEWKNVPHRSSPARGVRMKIVINTSTGIIDLMYGALPSGYSGAFESGVAGTVAISGPGGTGTGTGTGTQEIIGGAINGFVGTNGAATGYPAGNYVRFTPAGGNSAPTVTVTRNGGVNVPNNTVINVNYGDTLASLDLVITVDDPEGDNTKLAAGMTMIGATGIDMLEWEQAHQAVPYTRTPTTGVFNTAAGTTHVVDLVATDASLSTTFGFLIVQAPQPAQNPQMAVSDGAAVAHNQGAAGTNREFANRDIAAGASADLTITVSNSGTANLDVSSFNVTGDSADFVLNTSSITGPIATSGSGVFTIAFDPQTIGQKVAQISFNHNDPALPNPFSFEVMGIGTQTATAPILIVRETDVSGAPIQFGAAATGIRNFGSMDLTATPSAPITIFIQNVGNADLTVQVPASSNVQFTVTATGFPTTLIPGASITFEVRFTPTSAGLKTANLLFVHNDTSTTTPFTFGLQGEATTAAPPPPPPPGSNGGLSGGGGGGGGCASHSGSTGLWLLLATVASIIGVRTRRRALS